jgi:hypothetical protein
MRNPSDYPNQEPRTTLGDHDNPSLMPEPTLKRNELTFVDEHGIPIEPKETAPEWQRNMLIYGGLSGERDDEPNLISRMKIRKLRAIVGQQLEAQASMLYSGRMAMALIESSDALEFLDKLKELQVSAQLTMETCARLIACGEKEER